MIWPRARAPILQRVRYVLIGCFVVAAVVLAFFGGRYVERDAFAAKSARLALAVEALQSGEDQAALSALTRMAAGGNPRAQYWLADMYQNGLGVKSDISTAIAWLDKSAQQGFVPAERRLGELYLDGDETLQDFGRARLWLTRAARGGDGTAERELGQIYALGLGVPVDLEKAYGWYENAVVSGDGMAAHLRDDLVTRMSPQEIAQAQQAAKDIAAQIKPAKA